MLPLLFALSLSVSAQAAAVFADFSEEPAVKLEKLGEKELNAILKAVLPAHTRDREHCEGSEGVIEGAQVVKGHFSSKKKEQLLVGLNVNTCPISHVGESTMVALVEDGKALDVKETRGGRFWKVYDSSSEGLSDVLMEGAYMGQGYLTVFGETLTFEGGKIKKSGLISDSVLARDSCGNDDQTGTQEVTVFFEEKPKPLKLSLKTYTRKCTAGKKDFKFLSNKPLEAY